MSRAREGKCPHDLIQHCPLYVASHIADAGGCDDGRLHEGGCAVDRGLRYGATLSKLRVTQPRMVAQCEFAEQTLADRAQLLRNMKSVGLH